MAFDLARAARTVHAKHSDAFGFRFALLDLLFAAGCNVREQAVALEGGDAICVRTAGPAAPSPAQRLVIFALDLELPALHGGDPAGCWPGWLAPLGGPATAMAWLAALHALQDSKQQRPWELVFVRAPALGGPAFLRDLIEMEGDAEVVVLLPASELPMQPWDLLRLELNRPRNIWRFPACDHTARVAGKAPFGQAWTALRQALSALGPAAAWTLHDLKIAAGENADFSAVLRTSVALPAVEGLQTSALDSDARLLFPINDALSALQQLGERLPNDAAEALLQPHHAATLPDGLCLHTLVPPLPEDLELADRAGAMSATWQVEPLTRDTPQRPQRLLAVSAAEIQGATLAELPAAVTLWRTPPRLDDGELPGLLRALSSLVG